MAGPCRADLGVHKCHATSGIQDQSKEGEEAAHQPEHSIGLVLGQCTDYLHSRLKGQEIWEQTSNDLDLQDS